MALTPAALPALRARSRLDRALWHGLAAARGIPDRAALAGDAQLLGTARFADLLAGRQAT